MENKVKQCKHNVKLAFNNDEIISYCDKCGKILDRYVKIQTAQYPYYDYIPINHAICGGNVGGSVTLTSDINSSNIRG